MTGKMTMIPLDHSQLLKIFRDQLNNGWCMVDGDLDEIIRLENSVYPPGTHKNSNFEMVFCLPTSLFICKKNADLSKALGKPVDFGNLLAITCTTSNTRMILHADGEKDACIDDIIQHISSVLKGGK